MKRLRRLIALAVLGLGCDPVALHGRVVRCSDRRPIDGARIQMTDKLAPERRTFGQSDADGTYRVEVPGSGDFHQTTTAPGHRQDERDVPNTPAESEKDHEICLWPARK